MNYRMNCLGQEWESEQINLGIEWMQKEWVGKWMSGWWMNRPHKEEQE